MLIKYIKSILWRAVKCLSYIQDARCLKVKPAPYLKQCCTLKCYVFGSRPENSLLFLKPQPMSDQLVIVRDHKNVKYERTFADVGCRPYLFHHTSIKIGSTGFISLSPSHLCIKRTLCPTRRLWVLTIASNCQYLSQTSSPFQ